MFCLLIQHINFAYIKHYSTFPDRRRTTSPSVMKQVVSGKSWNEETMPMKDEVWDETNYA